MYFINYCNVNTSISRHWIFRFIANFSSWKFLNMSQAFNNCRNIIHYITYITLQYTVKLFECKTFVWIFEIAIG